MRLLRSGSANFRPCKLCWQLMKYEPSWPRNCVCCKRVLTIARKMINYWRTWRRHTRTWRPSGQQLPRAGHAKSYRCETIIYVEGLHAALLSASVMPGALLNGIEVAKYASNIIYTSVATHSLLCVIKIINYWAHGQLHVQGLGFTTEMQNRETRKFSGGWRMRVSLARYV